VLCSPHAPLLQAPLPPRSSLPQQLLRQRQQLLCTQELLRLIG
jgi:hypothetical protein